MGELYVVGKTKRLKEDSKNTVDLFSKYAIEKTRQSLLRTAVDTVPPRTQGFIGSAVWWGNVTRKEGREDVILTLIFRICS